MVVLFIMSLMSISPLNIPTSSELRSGTACFGVISYRSLIPSLISSSLCLLVRIPVATTFIDGRLSNFAPYVWNSKSDLLTSSSISLLLFSICLGVKINLPERLSVFNTQLRLSGVFAVL